MDEAIFIRRLLGETPLKGTKRMAVYDIRALLVMLVIEEYGPLTVSSLCRHLDNLSTGTIVAWIEIAERSALVARIEHPHDRKKVIVTLTAPGKRERKRTRKNERKTPWIKPQPNK